jgi:hypothetical protein
MQRIEGGGSFTICPDTGAVTANHIEADAQAAADTSQVAVAESAAAPEPTAAPATGRRAKSTQQEA